MERSRACTYYVVPDSLLDSPVPPATAAALPLAVEVGGGHRSTEAVALGQVPGDEVGAPPWRVDGLPRCLPEHDECHTVDPRRRLRLLVRHHLGSCMQACTHAKSLINGSHLTICFSLGKAVGENN